MAEKVIHEQIVSSRSWRYLSGPARELFAPLLVKTDKWGRRQADLEEIRFDCIPGLPWSDTELLEALESLVQQEMVELYLVDGRWYLQIVNHDRFQRNLVRLRRGVSRFPDPVEKLATVGRSSVANEYVEAMLSPARGGARDSGLLPVRPEKPGIEKQAFRTTDTSHAPANNDNENEASDDEAERLAVEVRDGDEHTLQVFQSLRRRGLPPAAFASARELLVERRGASGRPPLRSEVRFVMSELKGALESGRYSGHAAA